MRAFLGRVSCNERRVAMSMFRIVDDNGDKRLSLEEIVKHAGDLDGSIGAFLRSSSMLHINLPSGPGSR